jgi:hypothetical protein
MNRKNRSMNMKELIQNTNLTNSRHGKAAEYGAL